MSYIIIVDMRKNSGQVLGIADVEDESALAQFDSYEAAADFIEHDPLSVFPYRIFDVDQLDDYRV